MKKAAQKITAVILTSLIFFSSFAFATSAFAKEESLSQKPFQRKLVITGYYSPIPGQLRYVRGSLEADRRLNGNGTNGADGTQVYRGMIAAPKNYP
ncbi:MAG TPA: hypothetical protein ENI70_00835, partial [Candidatus Peregrinibacteria bacterium]|nr:hypothetical protein [Candidatus Peregrinibacteria bacterium]